MIPKPKTKAKTMAKTVSDCCTRALKRLFIIQGGESASAEDAESARAAFEGIVNGWLADGLSVTDSAGTAIVVADYTLASTFPIAEQHFEGVAAMLAVSLAGDFQVEPTRDVQRDAMRGEQRIYADFMPSMLTKIDRALNRLDNSLLWPTQN